MSSSRIEYSEKYADEENEYRWVQVGGQYTTRCCGVIEQHTMATWMIGESAGIVFLRVIGLSESSYGTGMFAWIPRRSFLSRHSRRGDGAARGLVAEIRGAHRERKNDRGLPTALDDDGGGGSAVVAMRKTTNAPSPSFYFVAKWPRSPLFSSLIPKYNFFSPPPPQQKTLRNFYSHDNPSIASR